MVVVARRLFLLIYSRQFAISSTLSSFFRAIKLFDRTSLGHNKDGRSKLLPDFRAASLLGVYKK